MLSINSFAFICRVYAEECLTLTDLFDELAESLDACLEQLDEEGFVNTFIALTLNKRALK